MLKKALILTVGTGTRADINIVRPLVKTITNSAPNFIGFIVSTGSREVADRIVQELELSSEDFDMLQLSNEDHLEKIYSEIRRNVCESLREKTRTFVLVAVPEFDRLCDEMRFPWRSLPERLHES